MQAQKDTNLAINNLIFKIYVNPFKRLFEPYTPIEIRKKSKEILRALANIISRKYDTPQKPSNTPLANVGPIAQKRNFSAIVGTLGKVLVLLGDKDEPNLFHTLLWFPCRRIFLTSLVKLKQLLKLLQQLRNLLQQMRKSIATNQIVAKLSTMPKKSKVPSSDTNDSDNNSSIVWSLVMDDALIDAYHHENISGNRVGGIIWQVPSTVFQHYHPFQICLSDLNKHWYSKLKGQRKKEEMKDASLPCLNDVLPAEGYSYRSINRTTRSMKITKRSQTVSKVASAQNKHSP
ncbi:hypothetical protein RND71_015712 [Anisodus tanguticus]|uniref:Uncharacterized protein n=1 Tax=Anisodus tanguticus TaxID=243964 RepID=A0AAE1S7D3_9SOLA|nr:hypothetical protein RND71_015712 [Anisodus tanguticus]